MSKKFPDENDVDRYGMDKMTRKRLGLSKRSRVKKKGPISMVMPSALRIESTRRRSYKIDPVKMVFRKFYLSIPVFKKTIVGRIEREGRGYSASGIWPTSGKHIFDWELSVWPENKDFIVRYNIWRASGGIDGDVYRVSPWGIKKFLPKFRAFVLRSIGRSKSKEV